MSLTPEEIAALLPEAFTDGAKVKNLIDAFVALPEKPVGAYMALVGNILIETAPLGTALQVAMKT